MSRMMSLDLACDVPTLSTLLRSVRDVVQPLAAERRLTLRFSGPPNDQRIGQESALQRVLL